MIHQLQQRVLETSSQLDNDIHEYHDTISSFNVIEDVQFQHYLQNSQKSPNGDTSLNTSHSDKAMSISELNENIHKYNEVSGILNDLWVIRGLIQEVEAFITLQQSSLDYEVTDFDYLHSNLIKLNDKLNQLNNGLFIKLELVQKQSQLINDMKQLFAAIWKLYFPTMNQFNPVVNQIKLVDFMAVIEKFGQLNELVTLNEYLSPYQVQWENYLLDIPGKQLTLTTKDDIYELEIGPSKKQSEETIFANLTSIGAFIDFISATEIGSLKNYYQLKLSNKLINIISESINILMNDKSTNDKLMTIINTLTENHWHLSIDLNAQNYTEKLQQIFNNWLVDNYINKIRTKFKTAKLDNLQTVNWKIDNNLTVNDFEQKLNDMEKKIDSMSLEHKDTSAPTDEWDDGWNEEWNEDNEESKSQKVPEQEKEREQEPTKEEEDGWGDWNDWDENDKPRSPVIPKSSNNQHPSTIQHSSTIQQTQHKVDKEPSMIETEIRISELPNSLIETVNDFQIESIEDIDILVSTILSLSTITYPKLSDSYLMYNDLQYLGKNLSNDRLMTFSENLIKRQQTEISQQLTMILIKIRLTDEPQDENDSIYSLVNDWYKDKLAGQLGAMNYYKFKQLMIHSVDLINNWIINLILSTKDISENKSDQFNKLINNFQSIFHQYLQMIQEDPDKLETVNKVNNFKFLINNHLVDIIERFYQGEFYDLSTSELISTIESCFVKSDLRDNYINEIIEFRNIN